MLGSTFGASLVHCIYDMLSQKEKDKEEEEEKEEFHFPGSLTLGHLLTVHLSPEHLNKV